MTDFGGWRHSAIVVIRALAILVLLTFAACGGRAESGPTRQAEAGSGTGGGGAANMAEATPFYLDDALPWFDSSGVGAFPDGRQDVVLHVSAEGVPARATLSTFLPSDVLRSVRALRFSARATEATPLLVSVGHNLRTHDYFADSQAWPLAAVEVGQQWQMFSIDLAEFVPPESEQDRALLSVYVAFIIDEARQRELWFDDVSFSL